MASIYTNALVLRRLPTLLVALLWILGGCDTFKEDMRPTGANKTTIALADNYATTANRSIIIRPLLNDTVYSNARMVMASPAVGSIQAISQSDSFLYSPRTNYVGLDSVEYTLFSGNTTTTAKVKIRVERGSDSCKIVTVTDDIELMAFSSVTFNPVSNDLNCDPVGLSAYYTPYNGVAASGGRNLITYTPRPGFVGVDTCQYLICSVFGGCAQGKVILRVLANPSCDTAFRPQSDTVYFSSTQIQPVRFTIASLLENDRRCQGDINVNSFQTLNSPAAGSLYLTGTTLNYEPQGNAATVSFRYNISNATNTISRNATVVLVPR